MYSMPTRASRRTDGHSSGGPVRRACPRAVPLRRAEETINAGVRLRVVHQSGALAHKAVANYLHALDERGAWVRLRDNVPFRLLMIDREAAVCGAAPNADAGEDVFMIRGRRVITLLERVFETTGWTPSPCGPWWPNASGH